MFSVAFCHIQISPFWLLGLSVKCPLSWGSLCAFMESCPVVLLSVVQLCLLLFPAAGPWHQPCTLCSVLEQLVSCVTFLLLPLPSSHLRAPFLFEFTATNSSLFSGSSFTLWPS